MFTSVSTEIVLRTNDADLYDLVRPHARLLGLSAEQIGLTFGARIINEANGNLLIEMVPLRGQTPLQVYLYEFLPRVPTDFEEGRDIVPMYGRTGNFANISRIRDWELDTANLIATKLESSMIDATLALVLMLGYGLKHGYRPEIIPYEDIY